MRRFPSCAENDELLTVRPALALFSIGIAFFALILISGYACNFLRQPANPLLILVPVLFGLALLIAWGFLGGRRARLEGEPLELVGFLLVTVGIWIYFVYPSLPTLLPPSYSGDAASHSAYANTIYSTGYIFGDYPGGPALIIATLAHWIGALPVRLLHPTGAVWMALSAGGIYGIACSILPNGRANATLGLFAAAALFVPWNYSVGILVGADYFLTKAAAQFFVVAFVWFLTEYLNSFHDLWLIGMGLCLIAIGVSWQILLAPPLMLLVWALFDEWRKGAAPGRQALRAGTVVIGVPASFLAALSLTSPDLLPRLTRFHTASGAVHPPSLSAFGGIFFILPALGILLAFRVNPRARIAAAFMAVVVLQTLALAAVQFLLQISERWVFSSFYAWVFPIALLAVIPLAHSIASPSLIRLRSIFSSVRGFAAVCGVLAVTVFSLYSPPAFSPLSEAEIQVALWAKQHLDTRHIHYIGAKSLKASWLGVGLWGETYPSDLMIDLSALGPKTYEEWLYDPSWGEYLFVDDSQNFHLDPAVRVIYQKDNSALVEKPVARPAAPAGSADARFGDLFGLVGYSLPRHTFLPGEVITLTMQLETMNLPGNQVVWRLQLRDLQNNAIVESRHAPFDNKFPLQRWTRGKILSEVLRLRLPAVTRPGLYDLQLGLYFVGSGEAVPFKAADGSEDDVIHLASIKIPVSQVTTHQLGSITRTDLNVGEAFALLGYRLEKNSPIHPGDSFRVTLYWQSLAPARQDYTVFVHLLDPAGALRAQRDTSPRDGTYPTSIWNVGEIIVDSYILTVPLDAAPGEYRLEVGMYLWQSLQRLPVLGGDGDQRADHVILPTSVQVSGR